MPGTFEHLPPSLHELFATRGEGLLANQVWLTPPGTAAHELLSERFLQAGAAQPMEWSWLLSPEVVIAGESRDGRAFIAVASTPRPQFWICHQWEGVFAAGSTVSDLAEALVDGALFELAKGRVPNCFRLIESRRGPGDTTLDDLFVTEPTYDTRPEDASGSFREALKRPDAPAADGALEDFLARGLAVFQVPEAVRIAQEVGAAEVLETLSRIRKRNPNLVAMEARLSEPPGPPPDSRSAMVALGFQGTATLDANLRRQASLTRTPVVTYYTEAFEVAARALRATTMTDLRAAIAEQSPDDAYVFCALLVSHEHDFRSVRYGGNGGAPGRVFERAFVDRVWPVAALLLFRCNALQILNELEGINDALWVDVLDDYLAQPSGVGQVGFRIHDVDNMARARLALRPLSEDDVARISIVLQARSRPKSWDGSDDAQGLTQLLAQSGLDSALSLLARHATRDPSLCIEAAERRGPSPASRALLRAIWTQPRTHSASRALMAGRLSASWGDGEARAALPELETRAASERRREEADAKRMG
ncbi:MAG: hypothetical protein NVSMB53_12020 [Gemmatimonadaceae bacterium]